MLIVSDLDLDAEFVANALQVDPDLLPPGASQPYQVDRLRESELATKSADALKPYACVFWLNVARSTEADWLRLGNYVREGGGLVVALGHRTQPEVYNTEVAAAILPATLTKPNHPAQATSFAQFAPDHPLFEKYAKELSSDLGGVPVHQSWGVTPASTARPILSLAEGGPALLERTFKGTKTGRVLLWTTPLSRRPESDDVAAWNDFPQFWSFWYLVNQMIPYMAGQVGTRLNYEAGEDVILPLDQSRRFSNYIIQAPDSKSADRQSPAPTSSSLVIVAPQQIGQWSVTATGAEGATANLGFSVNPPIGETLIRPLKTEELDQLFGGKDKYQLADSAESLKKAQSYGRFGYEIYPWVMLLIMILISAENVLANKFYRGATARPAVA